MTLDDPGRLRDERITRKLDRWSIPTGQQYASAFARAKLRAVRALGGDLTATERDRLRGASAEVDAETLRRFRLTLPENRARGERGRLLNEAYGEAERRGVTLSYDDD